MIQKDLAYTFSGIAQKASAMTDYNQENLSELNDKALNDIRKNTPANALMLQYYLQQLAYIEQVKEIPTHNKVNTNQENTNFFLNDTGLHVRHTHRQSIISVKLNPETLQKLQKSFSKETNNEDVQSEEKEIEHLLTFENKQNIIKVIGHNPFDDHQSIIIQLRITMLLLGHAAITAAKLGKPIHHLLDNIERCYEQIQRWSPNEEKTRENKDITHHIDYLAYLMGYKLDDIQTALTSNELVFLDLGDNYKPNVQALTFKHIKGHLKSRSGFLLINGQLYYADFKNSTLKVIINDDDNNYANDIGQECKNKTQVITPALAHKIKICLNIKNENVGNVFKKGLKAFEKPRAFFTQSYAILSPLIKLLSTCLAYAKRLQKIVNDNKNKKSTSDMANLIIALILFPLRLLAFIYTVVDTRKSSKFSLKERFLRAFDEYGRDLWSGLFAATINCMTYFWLTGSGNLGFVGKVTSISVFAGMDVIASLFGGIRSAKRQRALVTMMRNNIKSIAETEDNDEINQLMIASDIKINETIKKILKKEELNDEEKAIRTKQIWAIIFVIRKAHAEYIHQRNTYIISTLHSLLSAAASAMITFPVFPVFLGPAITLLASVVNNIALSINEIYKTSRLIENLQSEYDQNETERTLLVEQAQIKGRELIGRDFHCMSNFDPNEAKDLKNCYVLANYNEINQANPVIYYYNATGDFKKVSITNYGQFIENFNKININLESKKTFITFKQIEQLITKNKDHEPIVNDNESLDISNKIQEINTHLCVFNNKKTDLQEKITYHHALRTYQKIVAFTNTFFDTAVTIGMLATFTCFPFGVVPILIAAGIMLVSMLVKAVGEKVFKDKIIEARMKVSRLSLFQTIESEPSNESDTEENKESEKESLIHTNLN